MLHLSQFQNKNILYFQSFAVQYWISGGFPSVKINLGIPIYARTWTTSGGNTEVGAFAAGAGPASTFTKEAGYKAYFEVKHDMITPN